MALPESLRDLIVEISAAILDAQRPIRVLKVLTWDESVEADFFASRARKLPRPTYRVSPEVAEASARLRALKDRVAGKNAVERFLRETIQALDRSARLLLAVGTRDFYYQSVEIYGRPASLSSDRRTTNLDLARHFDEVIAAWTAPESPDDALSIGAEEAAAQLGDRLRAFFPDREIRVSLDNELASNAAASADGVRLKTGARFSPRDIRQLEFHEGHVHMATSWNGRLQPVLTFLGHPISRTTRTQEGLAVLTEFLTRSTSLERLRRLSDRTIAIQMAEDGADFIELYRFFLDHGHAEPAAFDCARRVCRGGVVEGGAPFTKDVCYLDGLLRVTNFLRVALVRGRPDLVRLLFAGKMDVEDVPLLGRLHRDGIVDPPKYMPDWARDLSFLTAFMSYAAFLGETDLAAETVWFEDRVARAEADLD